MIPLQLAEVGVSSPINDENENVVSKDGLQKWTA